MLDYFLLFDNYFLIDLLLLNIFAVREYPAIIFGVLMSVLLLLLVVPPVVQVSSQVHGTVHGGPQELLLLLLDKTLLFLFEVALEVLLPLEGVASDGVLAKLRFVVLVGKEAVEGREGDVVVTMGLIVQLLVGRVEVVE